MSMQVLSARMEVLGPKHPDCARSMNSIAVYLTVSACSMNSIAMYLTVSARSFCGVVWTGTY